MAKICGLESLWQAINCVQDELWCYSLCQNVYFRFIWWTPSQEVVLLELWNLCFPHPPYYLFSYIINTQLFIHIQEQGIFVWKPRGFFTSNQLKLMKWLLINLMKLSSLIDWLIGRRRTDSWMLRICRRRLRRSRGWSRRRERSSSSSTTASEPPTSARIDTG